MKILKQRNYGLMSYISLIIIFLIMIQTQVQLIDCKTTKKRSFKSAVKGKIKLNTKQFNYNSLMNSEFNDSSDNDIKYRYNNRNIKDYWSDKQRINNINEGGLYSKNSLPFNDSFTFKKIHDCDEICLFRLRELDCTNGVYAKSSDVGRKLDCGCKNKDKELSFFIQNDFCYSIKGCTIKSFFKQCNRILNIQ